MYSGVFILISKKTWKEIGGFKTKGFTEVDNDLRKRLHENKIKFCILNGVYVYHWYRFDNKYRHSRKLLDRLQRMFKTNKDLTFDDIFLFDK